MTKTLPSLLLFFLLPCKIVAADSVDNTEFEPVVMGNDTISIECIWHDSDALSGLEYAAQTRNSFFVHDGMIYINTITNGLSASKAFLQCVDAETGKYAGLVKIDPAGYDFNPAYGFFVGEDSEGTPFVFPYTTSTIANVPAAIYPLDFSDDGTPTVAGKFELELMDKWFVRTPGICGSIKDGEFKVAASFWGYENLNYTRYSGCGIAEWKYNTASGKCSITNYANDFISATYVLPMPEDNRILVFDRGYIDKMTNVTFLATTPSIITLTQAHTAEIVDTFDGKIGNEYGNGIHIFSLGKRTLAAYASKAYSTEYAVASLPDTSTLSGAKHLWDLKQECFAEQDFEGVGNTTTTMTDGQAIKSVSSDDGKSANVYLMTRGRGMSAYKLSLADDSVLVGVANISDSTAEPSTFHTIDGRTIDSPTQPGIYIKRQGHKTTKILIK